MFCEHRAAVQQPPGSAGRATRGRGCVVFGWRQRRTGGLAAPEEHPEALPASLSVTGPLRGRSWQARGAPPGSTTLAVAHHYNGPSRPDGRRWGRGPGGARVRGTDGATGRRQPVGDPRARCVLKRSTITLASVHTRQKQSQAGTTRDRIETSTGRKHQSRSGKHQWQRRQRSGNDSSRIRNPLCVRGWEGASIAGAEPSGCGK